jgi:hypothetical protein
LPCDPRYWVMPTLQATISPFSEGRTMLFALQKPGAAHVPDGSIVLIKSATGLGMTAV